MGNRWLLWDQIVNNRSQLLPPLWPLVQLITTLIGLAVFIKISQERDISRVEQSSEKLVNFAYHTIKCKLVLSVQSWVMPKHDVFPSFVDLIKRYGWLFLCASIPTIIFINTSPKEWKSSLMDVKFFVCVTFVFDAEYLVLVHHTTVTLLLFGEKNLAAICCQNTLPNNISWNKFN